MNLPSLGRTLGLDVAVITAGLLGLSCSSLPTIVPDLGHRPALLAKQALGVQINLLRDSAGTFGTPAAFFQRLSEAGAQALEFNPVNPLTARKGRQWNQRDHRQLLIVDGRSALLGGINISSVYSGGSFGKAKRVDADAALAWRDTDLQVQGPVVAELQKLFLAAWQGQHGPPLQPRDCFPPLQAMGTQVLRAIGSSPEASGQADQVGARPGVSGVAVCSVRARIASGLDQRC